jgi:hypothetical protein
MKLIRKALTSMFGASAIMMATNVSAQLPAGWDDTLPAWTSAASSCSVDESSAGKYEFYGPTFRFLGANVSLTPGSGGLWYDLPITVRCNVTPQQGISWNALVVGYKDPDGMNMSAQVVVRLVHVNRATAAESTITTFNSNDVDDNVMTEGVKTFSHTFDFKNYAYYVYIDLSRNSTEVASPIVHSVRLTNGGV